MLECPRCKSDRVKKNGSNSAGSQQYLCKDCGRSFTGNLPGRPTDDDRFTVAVNFSHPVLATVKANAFSKNLSISEYLEQVLIEYFTE